MLRIGKPGLVRSSSRMAISGSIACRIVTEQSDSPRGLLPKALVLNEKSGQIRGEQLAPPAKRLGVDVMAIKPELTKNPRAARRPGETMQANHRCCPG